MFKISTKIRLKVLRKRLTERGVKSFRVTWAEGDFTPEQKAIDMCTALEAYLDGKYTSLKEFGDRP